MQKYFKLALIASLTLGLAPFAPHPHIWKQLRNLWLGRNMEGMDWIDLLMHGVPWILLVYICIEFLYKKARKAKP